MDDEPDVLDTIVVVLEMCRVDTTGDYERADDLLRTRSYDMVVLDVMGVRGLHLQEFSVNRTFPWVLVTHRHPVPKAAPYAGNSLAVLITGGNYVMP